MKSIHIYLLPIIIATISVFMIIEAGDYYTPFYDSKIQAYWIAAILEISLAILAFMYIKGRLILNVMIKSTMCLLFLLVVGSSSLKTVSPQLDQFTQNLNKQKLISELQSTSTQFEENLEHLKGQRVNTAVNINYQRKITDQIINEFKELNSQTNSISLNIGILTLQKIALQLTNLILAHILGMLWRSKTQIQKYKNESLKHNVTTQTQKRLPIKPQQKSVLPISHQKVLQYIRKREGKVSRAKITASRLLEGGADQYDAILNTLERSGKIQVDRNQNLKKFWLYCAV